MSQELNSSKPRNRITISYTLQFIQTKKQNNHFLHSPIHPNQETEHMGSSESPCDMNKCKSLKTLNPSQTSQDSGDRPNVQQADQTVLNVSPRSSGDGRVIYHLDSYSKTELKELKDKFINDLERIRSFVKKIEARGFKLVQVEDADFRKTGNSGDKSSKIIGQKRTMPVNPDRESKRRRPVNTMELNSTETRKVEAAMMRKCGVILEKLMKHKHGWVFNEPVDVVASGLKDYHQVVKRPMDLGTVKSNLGKCAYSNPLDFAKDVRLTFLNARLYNRKGEDVHTMATVLLDMFDKLFDPAYEKFLVERKRAFVEQQKVSKPLAEFTQSQVLVSSQRKRAFVEQQKVSKPLAEFTQSQVLVSSQRDTEKPLQVHPQAALPKKFCKEGAKKAVSKQKRTVPEAKENPRMRGEISDQERDQIGMVLQDFAGEYLDEILQIVAKRNSKMATPDGDGEIELDVCALDSETMWDLHRFVKAKQSNKKVSKPLAEFTQSQVLVSSQRKRAFVEKQKVSKPLAEFTQSQVLVSSQRDTEKPLQMHPQAALPKKICKEGAKKPLSKQKMTVPEAMENPRMRGEMSDQERDQIGMVLQDFAEEYLDEILQIVAKRNSKMATPDGDGEIELDVHALDSEIMWDLHRFVKAKQSNKII